METTLRQRWVLGGTVVAVLAFSALRFDGPTRGYWDTYIAVPAMFMTGQPVDLHRMDGAPRYRYTLKGRIPDDTYDPSPGGFGIASQDQRIGTAILFAAPFALVNKAAFRWVYAATWGLAFLFAFLSLRRLVPGFWAPYAASLFLVLNPFSLYLERLNGNQVGLVVLVFLWYLLTGPAPRWWLIGLVYGLLGGIRNEAIVLAPLFPAFAWRQSGRDWRPFLGRMAAFTAFAALAIAPVLAWNDFAYGQALIHPSQVARLEGFRPTFPHRFLGAEFHFNGLLNWPFCDRVVRTPHFAFPTFLHWPLTAIRSFGLVASALMLVGGAILARRRRFEGMVLVFWYGVVALLFAFQENWEELKQTFMALHLFPVAAFLAAGLAWLREGFREVRRWATVAVLAGALGLAARGTALLDIPADERWYVRFPHAARNDSGLDGLPEALRKDWHFFHTRETRAEIAREREHMTSPAPWPSLYRPFVAPPPDVWERIAGEPFERGHRTLAVWSYIYE